MAKINIKKSSKIKRKFIRILVILRKFHDYFSGEFAYRKFCQGVRQKGCFILTAELSLDDGRLQTRPSKTNLYSGCRNKKKFLKNRLNRNPKSRCC